MTVCLVRVNNGLFVTGSLNGFFFKKEEKSVLSSRGSLFLKFQHSAFNLLVQLLEVKGSFGGCSALLGFFKLLLGF